MGLSAEMVPGKRQPKFTGVHDDMSPIIKESGTVTATGERSRSGSGAGSSGDSAVKQQPVALEIPITVNGARTVEGSDKREPFSESTKTVMVFGSGAVIRLASALAPGQLLFLTNERTKKEVVCQVVKSKNYRNISGYVELEFTEPAVGFWGMRFPGDRVGAGPQAAPEAARPTAENSAVSRPVAAKTEQPPTPKAASPAPVSSKPTSPAAPSSSVVPAPLDSASLLGASKSRPGDSRVPVVPTLASSDAPLVEPWLKKRDPAPKAPAARPSTASREPAAKAEQEESSLPTARNFVLSRTSDKAASIFAPAEAPSNLSKVALSSLAPFFEVKPGPTEVPVPAPQPSAADDPKNEELKQHTARLQEQLSKMQFAEPVSSSPAAPAVDTQSAPTSEHSVSLPKADPVHESAVRLVEDSGASNAAALLPELAEHEEPSKVGPPAAIPALESLEQEELKIPAWLAPLARNASTPSSNQELFPGEKAQRIAEQPQWEEVTAPLGTPAKKEQVVESRAPRFGSALPLEEVKSTVKHPSKKSGKGMLFGAIAAGILVLAGGGWWYVNQQSAGVHASVPPEQAQSASAAAQNMQTNPQKEAALGTILPTPADTAGSQAKDAAANSNAPIHSAANLSNPAPSTSNGSAATVRNAQPSSNSLNNGSAVTTASSAQPEPVPAEIKKPALGEVHLARPKLSSKRTVQAGAAPDAEISLSDDQTDANADALGAGLGVANNQPTAPAAPVAVGGDVKPAKVISQVPPTYPALAKAQHVSGGVTINALIDTDGRVTKMKVISGPTLLQQAAMDALKQWKYQPATLDGKAVPMHLTVTIQFRLQ